MKKFQTAIVWIAIAPFLLVLFLWQFLPYSVQGKLFDKGWDYLAGKKQLSLEERVERIVTEESKDLPYDGGSAVVESVRRDGLNVVRVIRLKYDLPVDWETNTKFTEQRKVAVQDQCRNIASNSYYMAALNAGIDFVFVEINKSDQRQFEYRINKNTC